MVANGNQLAMAADKSVLLYNVETQSTTALADPFGSPLDLAIDKNASLYALNLAANGNIAMYPSGSGTPKELVCNAMPGGEAIAVDNEGDIFVNGYTKSFAGAVAEIPNGPNGPQPQNCTLLKLKSETGYVAGLAVDPKTDDLIVFDDPGVCAGPPEGRITIYPKPYKSATGRSRVLGGSCPGMLRLNADSSIVFYYEQDPSGSLFIRQSTYPGGHDLSGYKGPSPGGFTTIPNTLPN